MLAANTNVRDIAPSPPRFGYGSVRVAAFKGASIRDVRVGVVDRRRAMGRPPRMRDADVTVKRIGVELALQILELALGPPPLELAVLDRADPGAVIAPIFETLEPVEQPPRDRFTPDNPDNSTHARTRSFGPVRRLLCTSGALVHR